MAAIKYFWKLLHPVLSWKKKQNRKKKEEISKAGDKMEEFSVACMHKNVNKGN